jgi:hypothetical protein
MELIDGIICRADPSRRSSAGLHPPSRAKSRRGVMACITRRAKSWKPSTRPCGGGARRSGERRGGRRSFHEVSSGMKVTYAKLALAELEEILAACSACLLCPRLAVHSRPTRHFGKDVQVVRAAQRPRARRRPLVFSLLFTSGRCTAPNCPPRPRICLDRAFSRLLQEITMTALSFGTVSIQHRSAHCRPGLAPVAPGDRSSASNI